MQTCHPPVLLGQGHPNAMCMQGGQPQRGPMKPAIDDSSTVIWRDDAAAGPGRAGGGQLGIGVGRLPPMPAPSPVVVAPPAGSWGSGQKDRARAASGTTARSQEDAQSGSVSASSETTATPSQVSGSFPQAMTPLDLVPTSFRNGDFAFEGMSSLLHGEATMASWTACVDKLGFAAKRFLETKLPGGERTITGHISKLHSVIMSEEELESIGIEREAASLFAFTYPVATLQELQLTPKDAKVPDIALLVFGGFMYFDSDLQLRDVRAAVPTDGSGVLRFRAPQPWKPDWIATLGVHRWKPVTLPALRKVGVRYFCWLLPGEALPGRTEALTDNGGFAYIFHEPGETEVLQANFDTLFGIASRGEEDSTASRGKPCPKCARPLQWSDFSKGAYADGWDCENVQVCGMTAAMSGRHRWFCPDCSFDICNRCHSTMWTGGRD